jgi:hypothetical protein
VPPMRPEPDGGVVAVDQFTMTEAALAIGTIADDVRPVASGIGSHVSAVQGQVDNPFVGGGWSGFGLDAFWEDPQPGPAGLLVDAESITSRRISP